LAQEFCSNVENGSEWANHLVIQALESALEIAIVVVKEDGEV
jgi:hypothetical protein